jgi:indolepyruvate ferredoxin oxidoreductase beta subunit
MKMNIIIAGVGGQGILLSSRVIGKLAMDAGQDAKVSEVHGMSQRGGDVITHVRIGEHILSPLIEEGTADAIIAFEQLEALRALPFLKQDGLIVASTQKIPPMPVLTKAAEYPADILPRLQARGRLVTLDAQAVAVDCGAIRAVNVGLLGAFARQMDMDQTSWQNAIDACVPPQTKQSNQKAFLAGWRAAE